MNRTAQRCSRTLRRCGVLVAKALHGFEPLVRDDHPALRRRLSWVAQNFIRQETLTAANAMLPPTQNCPSPPIGETGKPLRLSGFWPQRASMLDLTPDTSASGQLVQHAVDQWVGATVKRSPSWPCSSNRKPSSTHLSTDTATFHLRLVLASGISILPAPADIGGAAVAYRQAAAMGSRRA